jgi:AcrR family transcriptional regulator
MTSLPRKKSSRRQIQKEETRRIILAAAYSLFGLRGYEKTTMRELADRADVGLGTIFKHFPDKPSLLISTFREDLEAVIQNSFDTLPSSNIKMQLTHIVAELYEFLGQNPAFSRILIKEGAFLEGSYGEMLTEKALFFREKIEGVIKKAAERGELDPSKKIRDVALTFMSFFLLGLIGGLRESEFNVKKQTLFFASLLNNHFAGSVLPGKL